MIIDMLGSILGGVEKTFGRADYGENILDIGICFIYARFINIAKTRGDENPEESALLSLDYYFNMDKIRIRTTIINDADLWNMTPFIALANHWSGDTQNATSIINLMTVKAINERFKTKAIELAMPSVVAAERSRIGATEGGHKAGESHKIHGEETKQNVLAQAKRLIDSGTAPRDLAGIIEKINGMPTARHIRTILKNTELKGG